jgi:hypothetical protein
MYPTLFRKLHFALRTLVPLFTGALAWCQVPTATVTGIDSLSHSTVRINYTWTNGPLVSTSILYAVAPAACTDGEAQPATNVAWGSPWAAVLAGLKPSTAYNVCIGLTNGSGTGVSQPIKVTTSALPLIHPALPIPPASFDSDYPDTRGYTTVTTAPDCSDLQSEIDRALYAQANHGTVIQE